MNNGFLALLIAYFIGGALSPLFAKIGTREFPPLLFTELRFLLAIIIVLPFYLKQKVKINLKKDKLLLFNCLFFIINVSLFNIGIQFTTTIMSQILYTTVPLFVAVLAFTLLQEKISINKIVGLIIGGIGVGILLLRSFGDQQMTFGEPLGNFLILVAVISWSVYAVLSKKVSTKHSPLTISFFNFVCAAIVLLFLVPVEAFIRPLSPDDVTMRGILSLLGIAILSSAVMTSLIQFGIKKVSALNASLFVYFVPLFSAITAVLILHEKITVHLVLSGLLIIAGVFYATTYELLKKKK